MQRNPETIAFPRQAFHNQSGMIAALIHRFGSPEVFKIQSTPDPKPCKGEVLVAVKASSVNPIDWKFRNGSLGFLAGRGFPKILGFDLAGEVVANGERSRRFKVGDAVYARSDRKTGEAYAELVSVGEGTLAAKPGTLTFQQAAAIPLAGLTALQALRDKAGLKAGDRALILGASGGVGSFAVQIAKALGAEVTAVCGTANVDLARELGADRTIDYKREDVRRTDLRFDVVFDAVATYGMMAMRPLMTERGRYVATLPGPAVTLAMLGGNWLSRKKGHFIRVRPLGGDLDFLSKLVTEGRLRPVIDSEFPLAAISEAHRRSETKHARGKIVITIA